MNEITKPAAHSGVGVDAPVRRERTIEGKRVWRNNVRAWAMSSEGVTARGATREEALQNLRMALSLPLVDPRLT